MGFLKILGEPRVTMRTPHPSTVTARRSPLQYFHAAQRLLVAHQPLLLYGRFDGVLSKVFRILRLGRFWFHMAVPPLKEAQCCLHEFFLRFFPFHLKDLCPHSQQRSCRIRRAELVDKNCPSRRASKHFRHGIDSRDFAENGKSPPILRANLFETIL